MDPTQLNLFNLAGRRLAWLDQRQSVLAENIANANTPGYTPRDLPPFAATLAAVTKSGLARTAPRHLNGTADPMLETIEPRPTARSPDGNAVALDQQLTKLADSETAQQLVTTIYKAYLGMFSTALGHGSG